MEKEEVKTKFEWPPLESDPEIFNTYLRNIGLSYEHEFVEVFSLDIESLLMIPQIVLAVIVNISRGENKCNFDNMIKINYTDVPFYMLQTGSLDNACGIVAALHAIGNNPKNINIVENSILSQFYEKCKEKTPKERSEILENFQDFKKKHEVFSKEGQSKLCNNQSDVRGHYIAFAILNDKLIEFDGVKGSPILLEENVKSQDFIMRVGEILKNRIKIKEITENMSMMYLS